VLTACIRELEGVIFQCGLRVDELKEQVEPSCEASPSSPPQPSSSSDPSEGEETLTRPQVPTSSLELFVWLCCVPELNRKSDF